MMKIKRILIENIGPYKNKEFIFEHSCSLIIDKNEAGKSVLAKSILEALYPSKQPILPLNNGKITLEIESDNEFFQIIRNDRGYQIFKNGNPIKQETKTKGRIIKKLPGEILFNIPKEIFINSSYLAQKAGINTKELYSVTSFLEQAIDTGFQDTSASSALTKIKEALYDNIHSGAIFPFNTKGKLDTAIKIWKEKLNEYEEKKAYLQQLVEKQTEIIKNYIESLSEFENINHELIKLDSDYATWKIQQNNFYLREIQTLEKRNDELKEFEGMVEFYKNFENLKPEEQQFIILYENEIQSLQKDLISKEERKKKIRTLLKNLYLINILTFVLSILGGIFIDKIFYVGVIFCIFVSFYQLKLNSENKKLNQDIKTLNLKYDDISKKIDHLISNFTASINSKNEFFSIFKKMSMHKNEIKEFIENSRKIEELKKLLLSEKEIDFYKSKIIFRNKASNNLNIEDYEQKKEKLLNLKEQINDKIHKLQADYDKIIQHRKEIEKINDHIQVAAKNLEILEKFKEALQRSFEVLENITKKHHEHWSQKLNEKASKLLSNITDKTVYISFGKDLSFNIRVPEIEYPLSEKEIENKLSGGITEQIYLTVRLILADILSKGMKIPFILDEPFAHSDDERFIKGMKYLIQEIANSNQVIILSCHQHRLKLIEELKGFFCIVSVSNEA